jgi:hypothetical protein
MSGFSDALHSFLTAAKAKFDSLASLVEGKAETAGEDALAEIEQIVNDAGPVIAQAAEAGVAALLASGPVGGLTAGLAAAESAAVNVLVQVGKPILTTDLAALKAAILNEFVKQGAVTNAAPAATTTTSTATPATPVPAASAAAATGSSS